MVLIKIRNIDLNKLKIYRLPTCLIVNNFLTGCKSNYEEYLNEFINASNFVKDYKEKFILRNRKQEQSHGECDSYNNYYELDFKLLADSNLMEVMKLYSDNIIIDEDKGAKIVCSSLKQGEGVGYDLLKLFKSKSLKDFEYISSKEKKDLNDKQEKIIKSYLKKIKMNKNILYFIPFEIYFENLKTDLEIAMIIISCIERDLHELIMYRYSITQKDTFFCFVSVNYMVFIKVVEGNFKLYDMVNLSASKTFVNLSQIANHM